MYASAVTGHRLPITDHPSQHMDEHYELPPGAVTIAPGVLTTIVRMTTLAHPRRAAAGPAHAVPA